MKNLCLLIVLTLITSSIIAQTNIRKGASSYGTVLYNWDGENIRKGSSSYGSVLYNYDGENIRKGSSSYGSVLYNTDGKIPTAILIYVIE